MNKKMALWLLLAALLAAYLVLDPGRFLNLDYLKHSQAALEQLQRAQPLRVAAAYFALYVAVTALSIPGATVMSLAGGALFGLGWGTLLVSFASSLGATLAFLSARFVLRGAVEARFGQRLAELNHGLAREGALYLLSLRLVPLAPFFLVNLLMGLTRMKTLTFYGVSQLGMLAATVVYVNAGTQLARLDSLQSILSPGLLGSFILLAAFPLLTRAFVRWLRQRRLLARWRGQKPRRFERNLVVIGAGAAGLVCAYLGATLRAKVTLIEAGKMGGDCLNTGCVPSKALIRSATLAHQMRHGSRYGLSDSAPVFSFRTLMRRVHAVVAAIAPQDSLERYQALGVEVLAGQARIVNPWTVELTQPDGATRRLSTRAIVIATGARPQVPPLPGLDTVGYLSSDTLWDAFAQLDEVPRRLLVLGGGALGCELAQSFQRLGAQVTLLELAPRVLTREDEDVSALAQASLQADGVRVLCDHQALRCEKAGAAKALVAQHLGREIRLEFDALLCAVGRVARLSGYGLEELGIAGEQTVATNAYLQTLYPNIFAAGDVAGPHQLTHAAAHQAWHATVNALFGDLKKFKVDNTLMPRAIFIDPEVARVGLNEQEARAQAIPFELTRIGFDALDRAIADSETQGFVKVLTVPGKDKMLGVTIVGPQAGELLPEYVLAMKHGLGLSKILGTVHSYPTRSGASARVAGAWARAHEPRKLLAWLARYHAWRRG